MLSTHPRISFSSLRSVTHSVSLCFLVCLKIVVRAKDLNIHHTGMGDIRGISHRQSWNDLRKISSIVHEHCLPHLGTVVSNPLWKIIRDGFAPGWALIINKSPIWFINEVFKQKQDLHSKIPLAFQVIEGKISITLSLPLDCQYIFECFTNNLSTD